MKTPHHKNYSIKLKHVLVLPFICLISLSVLISSYVTWKYSEETTNKLGTKISKQSAYFIQNELNYYLGGANNSNQFLKNAIEFGILDINDKEKTIDYITHVIKKNPSIGTLSLAYPDGSYVGIGNTKNGEIVKKTSSITNDRMFYTRELESNEIIQERAHYDARNRPWFKEAKISNTPIWSSIFQMFSDNELGVTFAESMYKENTFIGVIGTDVIFYDLNKQLNKIKLTDNSYLFILDEKNRIIAQSNVPQLNDHNSNQKKNFLPTIDESGNKLLKQVFNHVSNNSISNKSLANTHTLYDQTVFHESSKFTLNNISEEYFINYMPYVHGKGMNWHIGVVIPQSDLLGNINKIRKHTFIIWLVSFILSMTLGLLITYLINKSIKRLQVKISKVDASGIYEHDKHNIKEVNELSLAFSTMSKRLHQSHITSNTDALTNLANRRSFDTYLNKFWQDLKKEKITSIVLITFDIDLFKAFNDTYGHPAGDTCLYKFARVIELYTGDLGISARTGGEEFIIILPNTNIETAKNIADNIKKTLAKKKIVHKKSQPTGYVTTSIGISIANLDKTTANTKLELLNQADEALYQAKNIGKDCYVVYGE